MLCFHEAKHRTLDIIQQEGRTKFVLHVSEFHIVHFETADVADKKAVCRYLTEHVGFWIGSLFLGRFAQGLLRSAAALVNNENVAEFQILDLVARNSADD